MDDTALTRALLTKIHRRREEVAYADNITCHHVFVAQDLWQLIRVYGRPPGHPYTPPQSWEPGWSEHALGMLMGIGIIPSDTLNAGEWQLRDQAGTVRAFGTLDDIRQEHQP